MGTSVHGGSSPGTYVHEVQAQERWWTVGTIGALAVLCVFAWITENYLLYAIYFALVMVVTRLFQSRGSRDAFQLYGLSFVAMIAGAVIMYAGPAGQPARPRAPTRL